MLKNHCNPALRLLTQRQPWATAWVKHISRNNSSFEHKHENQCHLSLARCESTSCRQVSHAATHHLKQGDSPAPPIAQLHFAPSHPLRFKHQKRIGGILRAERGVTTAQLRLRMRQWRRCTPHAADRASAPAFDQNHDGAIAATPGCGGSERLNVSSDKNTGHAADGRINGK